LIKTSVLGLDSIDFSAELAMSVYRVVVTDFLLMTTLEDIKERVEKHWRSYVSIVAVVLAVGWLARGYFSSGLAYERVGPRPSAGRTVLVLLHGYGASGDDLVGFAEEVSKSAPAVSLVVPVAPYRVDSGFGRTWIPSFTVPTEGEVAPRFAQELERTSRAVWALIADIRRRGVRCEDIILGGFSQGGGIAAHAALRAPAGCALGGVIIMSGAPITSVPLIASDVAVTTRVLVTHGTQDPVISPGSGRTYGLHFARRGNPVTLLSFPGGHEIPALVREAVSAFARGESPGEPLLDDTPLAATDDVSN
jgi:phospholipase/carboxylesterase